MIEFCVNPKAISLKYKAMIYQLNFFFYCFFLLALKCLCAAMSQHILTII